MKILIIFACYHIWITTASRFRIPYPRFISEPVTGIPGEPVFVTPYIEAGKISDGQNASWVPPLLGNVRSYSGFITVNQTYNSNMFFWFFPSERNHHSDRVLLWLQGGPGVTSLYGLFEENGPYYVDESGPHLRNYTWTKNFNVLYLDNPVGTGYSFTQDEKGYARNQDDVATNLYSALVQFFRLFPNLQENYLILSGESYAGKYIPSLAYRIHEENPAAKIKMHLTILLIGNGYTDPENMFVYGNYLYQLGFIDQRTKKEIQHHEEAARVAIRAKNFKGAEYHDNVIFNIIHSAGIDDVDYTNSGGKSYSFMPEFVQSETVRKAIHVGCFAFSDYQEVYRRMRRDMYQSVAHLLPELSDYYTIAFYNGQLDVIVPYTATSNFLDKLSWNGAIAFSNSERFPLRVDNELVGYYKFGKNDPSKALVEFWIRNAGHMVPASQPKSMYEVLKYFM